MFLLVCLILGPTGAGSGEDSPSYVLQVHKLTSGEDGHNFITDIWFLCHVVTWTFHVATSILHAFVTSRRGPPTSRRQFSPSLSRRDVDFPRRDVNFTCLFHVATWTSHVATSVFTSLCHVATWTSHVTTLVFTSLCHVARLTIMSRRRFLPVSVMSRRHPARRDVT